MKYFSLLNYLALILSISGCASLKQEPKLGDRINNVGSLAVLDEKLSIRFVQNGKILKDVNYDTNGWALNNIVNREIQSSFKSSGKQAIGISVDNELIEDKRSDALQLKNIYLGNRYQGVQRYILDEAKKQGVQYLVVMHPMSSNENENARGGYGVLCEGTTSQNHLVAYLSIGMEVWDVNSLDNLGKTVLTFKDLSIETPYSCDKAFRTANLDLASSLRPLFEDLTRRATHLALSKVDLR